MKIVFELNIQRVNNDDYLKTYKINNRKLINDKKLLHNFMHFEGENNLNFDTSLHVYEDLNKNKSSRHEFIYPSYSLQKIININNGILLL